MSINFHWLWYIKILSFLCQNVCCWLYGVRLGWFVGPKFLLCDGLGWVEEIGPAAKYCKKVCKPLLPNLSGVSPHYLVRLEVVLMKILKLWNRNKHVPIKGKSLFTALHAMQTRSSDENSVCPPVCLSNACIVTKRKKNLSRFLYRAKDHSV